MGIPANMLRFTFSGAIGGGERWATSVFMKGYSIDDVDAAFATNISTGTAFPALITAVRNMLATDDTWSDFDAYFYDGGTAAVRHSHVAIGATGLGGTGLPKQTACVVTLRTALTSRSGRGRMYFPATGATMAPGGKMVNTKVDALVDALGNWFGSMDDGTTRPVVVSQTHTSFQVCTSVDADYVPDTQRGRRAKITSTRHSHSTAAA